MKTLYFSFVILLGLWSNFSQVNPDNIPTYIYEGTGFYDAKSLPKLSFSVEDLTGGFIVGFEKNKGKSLLIEHYDSLLHIKKQLELPLPKARMSGCIDKAFLLPDGQLCIIEYVINRYKKQVEFYALTAHTSDFNFKRKRLLVYPIRKLLQKPYFTYKDKVFNKAFPKVIYSENNRFFSIVLRLKTKGKKRKYHFKTFDNRLQTIYNTDFVTDISEQKFGLLDMSINDQNGDIYLLAKTLSKKFKQNHNPKNITYKLYRINSLNKGIFLFNSTTKYINNLNVNYVNKKLLVTGFFSSVHDNRITGAIYIKVNPEKMTLENVRFLNFPEQFLQDKYHYIQPKKRTGIVLKNIFFNTYNELILVTEEQYKIRKKSKYLYSFNDITAIKFSSKGDLLWTRNIHKKQLGGNSPYLSFSATLFNDDLFIFVNTAAQIEITPHQFICFKKTTPKKVPELHILKISNLGKASFTNIAQTHGYQIKTAVGFDTHKGKDMILWGHRKNLRKFWSVSLDVSDIFQKKSLSGNTNSDG